MVEYVSCHLVHYRGAILCVYILSIIIMENKEKKGFRASLFSSKSNKCSCSAGYTIPTEKESTVAPVVDASKVKEIKVLGPGCAKCEE